MCLVVISIRCQKWKSSKHSLAKRPLIENERTVSTSVSWSGYSEIGQIYQVDAIYLFIYSFIYSFTYLFIYLFTCLFIYSFIYVFMNIL